MRACVRACVRSCMCVCFRACMRVCVEIYFKQIEDTIGELFPNKFGDKKHGAYERAKDSPNRTVVLV